MFARRFESMLHAVGLSLTCSFMVLTINSIFEQFDPLSPEDRDQCCVSLGQEAILSYRFLFGQYGNSKKVACEKLCSLKNEYPNQNVYSMLLDLCERKHDYGRLWWNTYDKILQGYPSEIWPITCQTMEDISRKATFKVFEMTSQDLSHG